MADVPYTVTIPPLDWHPNAHNGFTFDSNRDDGTFYATNQVVEIQLNGNPSMSGWEHVDCTLQGGNEKEARLPRYSGKRMPSKAHVSYAGVIYKVPFGVQVNIPVAIKNALIGAGYRVT